MIKVEIIAIMKEGPKQLEKLTVEDFSSNWRPHIGETIVVRSGQYEVKGVAHMWDDMVIKVLVEPLFIHK